MRTRDSRKSVAGSAAVSAGISAGAGCLGSLLTSVSHSGRAFDRELDDAAEIETVRVTVTPRLKKGIDKPSV